MHPPVCLIRTRIGKMSFLCMLCMFLDYLIKYQTVNRYTDCILNIKQKMNEKLLEKKLRIEVKKLGGIALKFGTTYHTGMPDRIVLMPGAEASFVELKSTGKKPTALQIKALGELAGFGFKTAVIDSQERLDEFLNELL